MRTEEAPRDRRRLRAAHARPTEAMPTVTILRTPLGKLGCRISPDDRVSEVHARGAADLAGLKVGCLVKSINGKPVSELPDLIKQSVFKFVMEVEDAPPKNKMAPGKKRKGAGGRPAASAGASSSFHSHLASTSSRHLMPSSPLIALIPLVPLIPLIALIPPRPHLP